MPPRRIPPLPICELSDRVLSRLEASEIAEPDLHLQTDLRIAWITVLYAARNFPEPDVLASYRVLGLHPEKIWPSIVERRKALLGPLYEKFWGAPPTARKPVQSVSLWRSENTNGAKARNPRAA